MAEPDESTVNALGRVHVYTGNGKGKTTACMGLALRAAGYGLRVYIGQFMKPGDSGEAMAIRARLADLVTIEGYGKRGFVMSPAPPGGIDYANALGGLAKARDAMMSGRYHLVILDEVLVAVAFGLITPWVLAEFIRSRPNNVELVLSGRWAHPAILAEAELITEMREVRHYYEAGVTARKGVEE